MRISDWSSDVCSSDLVVTALSSGLIDGIWWRHILATVQATVLAFLVGFSVAIVVGSCFAFSALARETLYPYIVAIQSFPKVAVAPLLVVWLGYGLLPKIAIGGLLAFFPIFASTLAGLLDVDKDEVRSEEHTSELQSLMRTSYAVSCLQQT